MYTDDWQTYGGYDIQTIDERPEEEVWACYIYKHGESKLKLKVCQRKRKQAIASAIVYIDTWNSNP